MLNPRIPPEILDHVVDLLHDNPKTLKKCCLVSKSWIPRTRTHLFAKVGLPTNKELKSWKKTFQDPLTTPAYYTKTLFIGCAHLVTLADCEAGGWLRGFSRVVWLWVGTQGFDHRVRAVFAPFHGLSPVVKTLRMAFPSSFYPSQIFDLALSFPILEDLAVSNFSGLSDKWNNPNSLLPVIKHPSPFTGSLDIFLMGGIGPIADRLLSLPGGIHFRKFALRWYRERDPLSTTELVERCFRTIESLDIASYLSGFVRYGTCNDNLLLFLATFEPASIDISKAVRLRDVIFRPTTLNVEWITTALRAITPQHRDLRQITIYVPYSLTLLGSDNDVRENIGEAIFVHWSDLDRLLTQFWERSILPKVILTAPREYPQIRISCVESLLPEMTPMRRMIDPVE